MIAAPTRVWYAIPILVAALGSPATAAGQRWERQVRERLDRAVEAVRGSAQASTFQRFGMLNTTESATFEAGLERGQSYTILAVCDDDCARLELTLLTSHGSEIAKDRGSEGFPVLRYTVERPGSYRIRVVMETCSWNPCWYALAVVPSGKTASSAPAAPSKPSM